MLIQGVVFFLLGLVSVIRGQSNTCAFETCKECIQEKGCVWCINPFNISGKEFPHCLPDTVSDTSNWCNRVDVVSPKTEYNVITDEQFSEEEGNTIQMKPQRVKISLRKGEKFDLKFKFKNAENYPVDLYYLMDLSKSMENYKAKLAELGQDLAYQMRKITKKFRLGFGSFIDKRDLPFVSTVPSKLEAPCETEGKVKLKCASPYSFKHVVSLTQDDQKFVQEVKLANVSGNLDSPEGGLDALMQAMVCKDKIGWRDQARHLLIFSTDAEFHIAGDGKLAGVIEPNPGTCYSSDEEFLIYDYPSVSHINYVAQEKKVNIIFAIVKKGTALKVSYQHLSDNIDNSKFGEISQGTDSNIINLIVDNYNKIVQTVSFKSNASDEVDVTFSSNCGNDQPNRCNNVTVGQIIDFTATIELRQCPQDGQKTKIISIQPDGINESLLIELNFLCDCKCSQESDTTFEPNSPKCNGTGSLTCGVCNCPQGKSGKYCECDLLQNKAENVTLCMKEGSNEVCSGVGICKCEKCVCNIIPRSNDQKYTGKYCECDNQSCKREKGLLCSNRGTCKCNECECFTGYTGDSCACETAVTNCRRSNSDDICSNNGKCVCNRCQCAIKDNKRYSGKYCEDCPSCEAKRCNELRACVECQAYKSGSLNNDSCVTTCTEFQTQIVHKLESEGVEDVKKCRVPFNESCFIHFDYYYVEDKLVVKALDREVCTGPVDALPWILGVIATILIAGFIMLLIWKIVTSIHDKREYAKFENERKKLKWGNNHNPLYKEATSTFANPAYNRASARFSFRKE
ncbi:integrin beta-PS-like [Diabrotica undecimpunctata]|uniref:integrin beta-PS-like n=1 Tax=Diabrotica undecimpunctata TaxID=50387 RepID=UPI003B63C014